MFSCTAAKRLSMPNAPARPAPARKKDLLFKERTDCPLSDLDSGKGLPCPEGSVRLCEGRRGLTKKLPCFAATCIAARGYCLPHLPQRRKEAVDFGQRSGLLVGQYIYSPSFGGSTRTTQSLDLTDPP